jgi:hypothetical protein
VELREELFASAPDAAALGGSLPHCAWNACIPPLELWTAQGVPDPLLVHKLEIARALGAVALKVSLGHFNEHCDMTALAALLPAHGPLLLVENDQTAKVAGSNRCCSFSSVPSSLGCAWA